MKKSINKMRISYAFNNLKSSMTKTTINKQNSSKILSKNSKEIIIAQELYLNKINLLSIETGKVSFYQECLSNFMNWIIMIRNA